LLLLLVRANIPFGALRLFAFGGVRSAGYVILYAGANKGDFL